MKEAKRVKDPVTIKIDPVLKRGIDDYCMLHDVTFSSLMEGLAAKFIIENPLSADDKKMIERHRNDTSVIDALRNFQFKATGSTLKKSK